MLYGFLLLCAQADLVEAGPARKREPMAPLVKRGPQGVDLFFVVVEMTDEVYGRKREVAFRK